MSSHPSSDTEPVERTRSTQGRSPVDLPRSSGILCHISSLPGPFGIGDLGPDAYRFADILAEAGQRIWQVLPLVPVGLGHSPYSSPSTFAGNPLFISPTILERAGYPSPPGYDRSRSEARIDFEAVARHKRSFLASAYDHFEQRASRDEREAFERFRSENADWLEDFALFTALKHAYGSATWTKWPEEIARRDPDALERARSEFAREIEQQAFEQFLFERQWMRLKRYCGERGIALFGDLPIYVAHDSADVWAHPELFHLNDRGESTVVAGVPPDYFSETGQRWGNPLYRWDRMRQNDFAWWTRRFEYVLRFVDLIRLDHFRGFAGYWEIPAEEKTAVRGRWVEGPGDALFEAVQDSLGPLPLVAEDLGLITPDVTELMDRFGFPGMAVLHFAFGEGSDHAFLPHNLKRDIVAYTGTHDNDTTIGWWEHLKIDRAQQRSVRFIREYFHLDGSDEDLHWRALRAMLASPARIVVSPLQDVVGLGSEARMNTPGKGSGNWSWRFRWEEITDEARVRLRNMTAVYGRSDALDEVIGRS